jgi:two-component system, NarL family, nitrate/nitrite response regulator NarL
VQVLLLEPDQWRSLGLLQVLRSDPEIRFLGTNDPIRILALKFAPSDLRPDVVIIAHALLIDFHLTIIDHLKALFPNAKLLVTGNERDLNSIAEVLRAGTAGYFLLNSDPPNLLKALRVVKRGQMWAPRDAVALIGTDDFPATREFVTPTEIAILELLEEGLSNKDIARKLNVAPVTVKAHLTRLYRRFRVKTRLQLLAYAIAHHLVGPSTLFPSGN